MLSLKIQKLISIVLLMHILKIRSILTLPRHQNQSSVQPHELDADWPIRQIVLRFANSRGVSEWNERELNPNEFLAQTQTQTNNSQFEDDSDPVCGSNLNSYRSRSIRSGWWCQICAHPGPPGTWQIQAYPISIRRWIW